MKFHKIITSILAASLSLFILFTPVSAQTPEGYDYIIENFESNIKIQQDTSVLVTEKITTNYYVEKHGIFRVIPSVYSNKGKTLNTRLNVFSVTNENGNPYEYSVGRTSQSISIKIGDPDTTITGRHIYIISYKVNDFILKYDSVPEFYWNITGHEWDTPILKASAIVESPFAKITKVVCYAGVYKSTDTFCTNSFTENSAEFGTTKQTDPGSDFTIVVGLDTANNLQFPGPVEQAVKTVSDNWGYLAALAPVLVIFLLWWKNGRDEKFMGDNIYYKPENAKTEKVSLFKRKFLPTVYSPINNLTPSEVGTIVDERVDTHDLIAEIIELGRLGIIRIERIKKQGVFGKDDYSFTKLPNTEEKENKLKDFQKEILKELFRKASVLKTAGKIDSVYKNDATKKNEANSLVKENRYVLLSALKLNFYEALGPIKDKLYKSLIKDQIFARDPEKSRGGMIALYIFLSFMYGVTVLSYIFAQTLNPGPFILELLTAPIGIIFAYSMPKRKAWGYSLFRQAEGLRHYIKVGKWRQEIAEKQVFIEEMLPLAISLQVVDKLAKDMEELGIKPPEYMNNFTAATFSRDFTNFEKSAADNMVTGQSSSPSGHSSWSGGSGFSGGGGGSSGGGGGGGGGGSW